MILFALALAGCGDAARCGKDDVTEERWAACDRRCSGKDDAACARKRELAWRLCADHKLPTFCAKACADGNPEACAKK